GRSAGPSRPTINVKCSSAYGSSSSSRWQDSSHGLRDTEKCATETPRHREFLGFLCGSVPLWPMAPCLAGRAGVSPRPARRHVARGLQAAVFALIFCTIASGPASAQGTRLLRRPTVSRDLVAFAYAGDIWVVARSGGQARRVTATPEAETDPYFSPDGSRIAFTATVAGNTDV